VRGGLVHGQRGQNRENQQHQRSHGKRQRSPGEQLASGGRSAPAASGRGGRRQRSGVGADRTRGELRARQGRSGGNRAAHGAVEIRIERVESLQVLGGL